MSDSVRLCPSEEHERPVRAVARVSWPDGPYKPTDACMGHRDWFVRTAMDDVAAITITPIDEAFGACPVCGVSHPLRMDGTLRAHLTPYGLTCEGRGQKPKNRSQA